MVDLRPSASLGSIGTSNFTKLSDFLSSSTGSGRMTEKGQSAADMMERDRMERSLG